jgi:hypothetical protein
MFTLPYACAFLKPRPFLVALVAFALPHAASAQVTTIFSDDFSSGNLSQWTTPGSSTVSRSQLFVAKSTEIIRAVSGTASWTDYRFTCNATITSNAIGIVFRSPDNNDGYMFQLNIASAAARFHTKKSGTWIFISNLNYPFASGTAYAVEVDTSGSNYSLYINGTLLGSVSDSSFQQGVIGFRTGSTETATIDNVLVTQHLQPPHCHRHHQRPLHLPDHRLQ